VTHIFFDLDGTLTDSAEGITKSIQHALEKMDVPAPSLDELESYIGPSLFDTFGHLIGDNDRIDDAVALYRERFADVGLYENRLYEGVVETLNTLSASGYQLYVATSKPHVYANKILAHFEIDHFFKAVFGAELDGTRSDKVELLQFALTQTGVAAESAVMIGDRHHDMNGARHNKMRAIGALYGYGDRQELEAAGAHACCTTAHDIPALMREMLPLPA
jgi:phosphoglycolate phosphatase